MDFFGWIGVILGIFLAHEPRLERRRGLWRDFFGGEILGGIFFVVVVGDTRFVIILEALKNNYYKYMIGG